MSLCLDAVCSRHHSKPGCAYMRASLFVAYTTPAEHIIGRSIRTLRGPGTNKSTILRIFESIQSCTPISELRLVNYDQVNRYDSSHCNTLIFQRLDNAIVDPLPLLSQSLLTAASRQSLAD
eukprot:3597022-Pleurochrysis_carterae.AAC.1